MNLSWKNAISSETKESQIEKQLNEQINLENKLNRVIATIDIKLAPILSEKSIKEEEEDGKVEPIELVPLANELKNMNNLLNSNIDILSSIYNRIEL